MYWLTKTRCPKCKEVYPHEELGEAIGAITESLGGAPSNGWPNPDTRQVIGLVKIFKDIEVQRNGEKRRTYKYECFRCGKTISDKEYEKFVESDRGRLRRIKRSTYSVPGSGGINMDGAKVPPLEAFK